MKTALRFLISLLVVATILAPQPSMAAANRAVGEWAYTVDGANATVTGYSGSAGDVVVPDILGGMAVSAIGSSVFEGKAGIKSVSLPAKVTVIGDSAFKGCTGLQSVKLPEYLLGFGDSAFAGCTSLVSVAIPKWVNNISSGAFEGCTALSAVYFEGQPPAISATAFSGAAEKLRFFGHVTQTGWISYTDRPVTTYCHATLELLDGKAPNKSVITLSGGKADPAPANPVRTGYQFAGWYQEAACLNNWNFAKAVIGNDIVLYALWKPVQHNVSFDSQGGSATAPITASYGSPIPAPADPTREKFVFGGWYRDKACTSAWSIATEPLRGDITLYARWVIPATPEELKAVSASASSITLQWEAPEYTSGYEVYRAISSKGKLSLIATVYTSSFTDNKLKLGTSYYYRVKPFKQLETARVYGVESAVVSTRPVPAAPELQAMHTSKETIKVSWGAVAGATRYEVCRAEKAGGPFILVKTLTSTTWWNNGLAADTEYYYMVRAYAIVKGKKVYGPYSKPILVKPEQPAAN